MLLSRDQRNSSRRAGNVVTTSLIRLRQNHYSYHSPPKFELMDREDQFQTIHELKKEINSLMNENKQLKAQLRYQKKEYDQIASLSGDQDQLTSHLKLKVAFRQLLQKDAEIEELKKNANNANFQALNEQIKLLQLQCDLQQETLGKLSIDGSIQCLQNDNIELTKIVTSLEQKMKDYEQVKRNYLIMQCKVHNQQKLIASLQTDLRSFKERDTLFQQKHGIKNQQLEKIQKLTSELNQLTQQYQDSEYEKDQQLLKYKKQISKYEQQLMEKDDDLMRMSAKLQEMSKQCQEDQQELASYKKLEKATYSVFRPPMLSNQNSLGRLSQDFTPQSQRSISTNTRPKQQSIFVHKEDVQLISKRVKFQLINAQISLEQVDQYLFKDGTETNLEDLKLALQKQVFGLTASQAQNLATYLIDSEEDTVQANTRIKSIFKVLMDNYVILNQNQLITIKEELSQISKQISQISEYIQKKEQGPSYKIEVSDIIQKTLFEALIVNDIKLSRMALEYLQAKLFSVNNNFSFKLEQLEQFC